MKNKKIQGILALTLTTLICTTILYFVRTWIGV